MSPKAKKIDLPNPLLKKLIAYVMGMAASGEPVSKTAGALRNPPASHRSRDFLTPVWLLLLPDPTQATGPPTVPGIRGDSHLISPLVIKMTIN